MKEKRFTKKQMLCAVLLTAALTLGGVLLLLCALLGRDGLAVMEGFVLIRTLFVEDADLKQVADDALFVLEHGARNDFSQHPCFVEHRAYGSVNFSFFKKRTAE